MHNGPVRGADKIESKKDDAGNFLLLLVINQSLVVDVYDVFLFSLYLGECSQDVLFDLMLEGVDIGCRF